MSGVKILRIVLIIVIIVVMVRPNNRNNRKNINSTRLQHGAEFLKRVKHVGGNHACTNGPVKSLDKKLLLFSLGV